MDDDILNFHKVNPNDDLADLLTKSIPGWKHAQLRSWTIYSDNINIS